MTMRKYLHILLLIISLFWVSSCSDTTDDSVVVNWEDNTELTSAPEEIQNILDRWETIEETSSDSLTESIAYIENIQWSVLKLTNTGYSKLQQWDFLSSWERILTLKESQVTLIFEDDSTIRLWANTSFTLEDISKTWVKTILNKWTLWGRILKPVWSERDFQITANDVSATVRGTSLFVESDIIDGKTEVSVIDSYSEEGVLIEYIGKEIVLQAEEKFLVRIEKQEAEKQKFSIQEIFQENIIIKQNVKQDLIYMKYLVEKKKQEENPDIATIEKIEVEIRNTIPKLEEVQSFFNNQEIIDIVIHKESENISGSFIEEGFDLERDIIALILKDEIITTIKEVPEDGEDIIINKILEEDFSWENTKAIIETAFEKKDEVEQEKTTYILDTTNKLLTPSITVKERIIDSNMDKKKKKLQELKTRILENKKKKDQEETGESVSVDIHEIVKIIGTEVVAENEEGIEQKEEGIKQGSNLDIISTLFQEIAITLPLEEEGTILEKSKEDTQEIIAEEQEIFDTTGVLKIEREKLLRSVSILEEEKEWLFSRVNEIESLLDISDLENTSEADETSFSKNKEILHDYKNDIHVKKEVLQDTKNQIIESKELSDMVKYSARLDSLFFFDAELYKKLKNFKQEIEEQRKEIILRFTQIQEIGDSLPDTTDETSTDTEEEIGDSLPDTTDETSTDTEEEIGDSLPGTIDETNTEEEIGDSLPDTTDETHIEGGDDTSIEWWDPLSGTTSGITGDNNTDTSSPTWGVGIVDNGDTDGGTGTWWGGTTDTWGNTTDTGSTVEEPEEDPYDPEDDIYVVGIHSDFQFSAQLSSAGDYADLQWSEFNGNGTFISYKVYRSSFNPLDSYPEEWYIQQSSDKTLSQHQDHDVFEGTTYYWICATISSGKRYCSYTSQVTKQSQGNFDVKKIEVEGKLAHVETKKQEIPSTISYVRGFLDFSALPNTTPEDSVFVNQKNQELDDLLDDVDKYKNSNIQVWYDTLDIATTIEQLTSVETQVDDALSELDSVDTQAESIYNEIDAKIQEINNR